MFETLALLGGFWFFLLVAAVLVFGIISTETDSLFGAILTYVIMIAGFVFLGLPVGTFILQNPIVILLGAIAYWVIGIVYVVLYRYKSFLASHKDDIQRNYKFWKNRVIDDNKWKKKHDPEGYVENLDLSFEQYVNTNTYNTYSPNKVWNHILAWIFLWPWDLVWNLIHKPIRFVIRWTKEVIFESLTNIYKKQMNKLNMENK